MTRSHFAARLAALSLLVTAVATAGCDGGATAPGVPGSLQVFDGSGQTAVAGSALEQELTVRVLDANGLPRGGVRVTWAVTQGGGSVQPATSLTALNGLARTTLTLGTTAGGNSVSASVEGLPPVSFGAVGAAGPPAAVVVSPETLFSDAVGTTTQLAASVRDQHGNAINGAAVTWSSSNAAVAAVSPSGLVTIQGRGAATVTASAAGASAGVPVTVPLISSVVIIPDGANLAALGATWQFGAIVQDDRSQTVADIPTWTSLNPAVATVDATGKATAVTNGSARIVAATGGKADTATVQVAQVPVTVTVTPPSTVLTVGGNTQLTASAADANGFAIAGQALTWSSSNPAAASVSASGQVSGVARGTAAITATAGTVNGSATIQVALPFTTVDAGGSHACGLSPGTGGNVTYCWGQNLQGRLGDGTTVDRNVPTQVPGALVFSAISAGGFHTCAAATDGKAYCWGAGGNGQLGDLSTADQSAPVPVATALTFNRVSSGSFHTCALTTDDDAYCWGNDQYGQLGVGGTAANCAPGVPCQTTPQLVSGGLKFKDIAAGLRHTCGSLRTTGDVYCWGYNASGELGTGDLVDSNVPRLVTGLTGASSVTVGEEHSCAALTAGSVYCWGANEFGQLGRGNALASSPTPLVVSLGGTAAGVTAGLDHTCAWLTSGTAYCWGLGTSGQLGLGNTVTVPSPSVVSGGLNWTRLSAGRESTCGVAGSLLYCWGRNNVGQLGLGDLVVRLVPTRVVDPL